ncbi:MAG TPA: 3-hydroxyacyl-CoA dehydrogenase family protein, partial [Bryobacteraceae bacterium]
YLREAQFLVEEGASVEQVNDALYTFGMAMGPLAVDDLSGLDISHAIRKEFAHLEKPGVRKPLVAALLCEQKRFGQKSGRGWSQYDTARRPSPDPDTAALIEQTAQAAGINRRRIANEEIVDRCIYALVNEGARLLEEGVAMRASDIDVTYLYGYGFPAWRGGPMFYADTVGLPNVLARIRKFEQQHGSDLWSPAPLLLELAAKDTTFSALDAQP